jgi:hypothetical protein
LSLNLVRHEPDGTALYVTNHAGGFVLVIDTATNASSIQFLLGQVRRVDCSHLGASDQPVSLDSQLNFCTENRS